MESHTFSATWGALNPSPQPQRWWEPPPPGLYAREEKPLKICLSSLLDMKSCPPVIADALPKALVIAAGKHKLSEHSDHREIQV
ncbi:hypothetical protein PVAP13_8NG232801 [Panicum virgatum]|uniref:Uncharacterized protein n=1 Tax=Panicum virgatum TaxID=38727 RepID=A0A8T0P6J2_PANVG|nr:hypothetical protein PVAP13_8NG232801 [Panicum virgatum]